MTATWTAWSKERPTDTGATYRWRLPERKILGAMLVPEWNDKLHCVGMGYADNEWWAGCSHWDGWNRTVPKGLEWRLATEDDPLITYGGLDLVPDPWTGRPPRVEPVGRWIAAPCYEIEAVYLRCRFGSTRWESIPRMVAAWNSPHPTRLSPDETLGERG